MLRNLNSNMTPLWVKRPPANALSLVPQCCAVRSRPLLSRSQWLPYSLWDLPLNPLVSLAVFRLLTCTTKGRRWLRPNTPLVFLIFIQLDPRALTSQNRDWSLVQMPVLPVVLLLRRLRPLMPHGPPRYDCLSTTPGASDDRTGAF